MKLYTDRDIFDFVMYYIYGQSGPSLLIESTDSMIPWVEDGGREVTSLVVEVAVEDAEVVGVSDVETEVAIEVEGIAIIQLVGIGMGGGGL